jgi:hypothetical protein
MDTLTAPADEDLTADDYYTADDPEDDQDPAAPTGAGGAGTAAPPDHDPGDPPPSGPEAPFGWTRDRHTGQWRPKLRPGRPPKAPPGAEELAEGPPADREQDQPPREDAKPAGPAPGAPDEPVAMPAAGFIARKVNKLYRRAGRIISAKDEEIGAAFIAAGTKEDEDDVTAGEAWENLCRVNPRIRAWVMRLLTGGLYWDLVMAHAPIMLAILMKPAVLKYIPFRALLERWAEPDGTATPEDGPDLRPGDVGQMMDMAESQARRMAAGLGMKDIPPEVMRAARQQAERQAAAQAGTAPTGDATTAPPARPPGNRHQRRAAQSRAARRKAGAKR